MGSISSYRCVVGDVWCFMMRLEFGFLYCDDICFMGVGQVLEFSELFVYSVDVYLYYFEVVDVVGGCVRVLLLL